MSPLIGLKKHVVSVEVIKYSLSSLELWEGPGRRLWGHECGSAGTGDRPGRRASLKRELVPKRSMAKWPRYSPQVSIE